MKIISKKVLSVIIAVVLLVISVPVSFAASNTQVKKGSTVEYTLSIAGSKQKITGIHFELYFDKSVMTVKDVNTDNLSGSTVNADTNSQGRITVVNGLVNGSRGLECQAKVDLVTVTFDVIKDGDAEVQYYIPYMYDYDMVNIENYTLTHKFSVDGDTVTDNKPPVLADVNKLQERIPGFDKGDFENNQNGKGGNGGTIITVNTEETTAPAENVTNNAQANSENGADGGKNTAVYEYVFSLSDVDEKVSALQIAFSFNTKSLRLKDVEGLALKDAIVNYDKNNSGKIYVIKDFDDSPVSFAEKTDLVKLVFELINEDDTQVKFYITEMVSAGAEDTDYKVLEKVIIDNEVVVDERSAATNDELAIDNAAPQNGTAADNTTESDDGNSGSTIVIILVCAGMVIAAIVVLVVVKSKRDNDSADEVEVE